MFRHILLTATVLISFGLSSFAHAVNDDDQILPTGDNRPVPFPMGTVDKFPWSSIQGLWKVEQGDYVSYFAFKKVRASKGMHRQLQVRQIDFRSCEELATGVGYENSTGTRVLAQMTAKKSGTPYRLVLTSVREEVPEFPPHASSMQSVMVLSLGLGSSDVVKDDMVHIEITKVSTHQAPKACEEELKK
jgi:hypothetical protein